MGNSSNPQARNIVASLFVIIWGLRLSGFLLFRILKTGKDDRFDDKRDHFWKFLGFWGFQMVWVWSVSLPVTILNSPNVSYGPEGGGTSGFKAATDIIGIVLFAVGFVIEAVADVQKVDTQDLPRMKSFPCLSSFLFTLYNRSPRVRSSGGSLMVVSIQEHE
jgi:steroid 5-alpha reductase family enzyme